jgi:nucleotide-binding universal stress UspA family protein
MWRRILVATGGSPWSNAAVAYATALAVDTGAEVCLLTVLSAPTTFDTFDGDFAAWPARCR